MTDIAALGIQINSSTAPKAVKELDALTVSAGKAEGAANRLGAATNQVTPAMAKGGHQSRMMAMQLSQVAQQASATGNFVQALAIQLPDMAMGFGAAGIAAGVLAGVALPVLVGMIGSTTNAADGLKKAVEGLSESTDAYIAAAEAAGASTASLAEKYGTLAIEARSALQALSDVAQVQVINDTNAAIKEAIGLIGDIQKINARDAGKLVFASEFDVGAEAAGRLTQALNELASANGLDAQSKAAAQVNAELKAAYGSVANMPPTIRAAYEQMAKLVIGTSEAATKTRDIRDLLASAAQAAAGAASAVSSIGAAAEGAYGAVSSLVAKMWEAAQARVQMLKDSSLNYGKVANAGGVDAIARAGNQAMGQDIDGEMTGGAGGAYRATGGGGGGSDPFKSDLEALIENLRTEREIEDEWYQENLAILQDRRAQEILGKQGHYEAMLSLNEEYQRRLREIDQAANSQRLTDMADLFGGLASIAQVGGQKTLKITAGLSAAQTIIAGYEAAMTAAAKAPTLAGKVAAYALWIGKSAQAVAAIRSAGGIGGGGGGGRGSIAAQGAGGQQAQAAEFRIYGFGRDKSYTGAELEQIFDGLHEVGKRRGIPVPTVVFV